MERYRHSKQSLVIESVTALLQMPEEVTEELYTMMNDAYTEEDLLNRPPTMSTWYSSSSPPQRHVPTFDCVNIIDKSYIDLRDATLNS